jgi:hypothetical protein
MLHNSHQEKFVERKAIFDYLNDQLKKCQQLSHHHIAIMSNMYASVINH